MMRHPITGAESHPEWDRVNAAYGHLANLRRAERHEEQQPGMPLERVVLWLSLGGMAVVALVAQVLA